jgi:adenylylsulfate kinase
VLHETIIPIAEVNVGPKSQNIRWHGANVSTEEREAALGQKGAVVWLTGLSGSGKSTIGRRAEQILLARGVVAFVLDGDNLRMGLNKDLGFSPADRTENIRRVASVAHLFAEAGVICITAFISPLRADRDAARKLFADVPGRFREVYVATSLEECERRDPKGLYQKARSGEIHEFTGVSAPYEEPVNPDLVLRTEGRSVDEAAMDIVGHLEERGFIARS